MLIYIASYPRSGNTLCRNLIEHYFGIDTSSIHEQDQKGLSAHPSDSRLIIATNRETNEEYLLLKNGLEGQLTPDFRQELAASETAFFLKTHNLPFTSYVAGEKVINLIRHPAATLWSYYKFINQIDGDTITLEETIKGNTFFGSWSRHITAWLKASDTLQDDFYQLTYSDLVDDETKLIQKVTAWTGLTPIVERGTFPDFEHWHKQLPLFYRSGKKDEWEQHYTEGHIRLLVAHHYNAMLKTGYGLDTLGNFFDTDSHHDEMTQFQTLQSYADSLEDRYFMLLDQHQEAEAQLNNLEKRLTELQSIKGIVKRIISRLRKRNKTS